MNLNSLRSKIPEPKSAYGVLAAVIAVGEGTLVYLATKAEGSDRTLLIIGMMCLLVTVVISLILIEKYRTGVTKISFERQPEQKPEQKYDVFISSPMDAYKDDQIYKRERKKILRLVEAIRRDCHLHSIMYAGHNIRRMADFDVEDLSLKDCYKVLKTSKYYVMIYLEKIVSSVLVEAGWALAFNKKSTIFVHNKTDLPFLLRKAGQARADVNIYEVTDFDHILSLLRKNGVRILDTSLHDREVTTF